MRLPRMTTRRWVIAVVAMLTAGECLIFVANKTKEIERGRRYHASAIRAYRVFMNDPESLRWSSQVTGKSPEKIYEWYGKAIKYHSDQLRKWERATLYTRLPVTDPPPF